MSEDQDNKQGAPASAGNAASEADPRNPNAKPIEAAAPAPQPQAEPEQRHPDAPDPEITHLIYMPGPHDAPTTNVDGLEFKAFEETELPEGKRYLGSKLHANPFFSSAHDVKPEHDDRKAAFEAAQQIKKQADEAKAKLDELAKS
jgi:hypothetical protein